MVDSAKKTNVRLSRDIFPAEAWELISKNRKRDDLVIIDVSTPQEYEDLHLEGAINVNLLSRFFKTRLEIMNKGNIPDDTHLLVRCHPNDDFKRYAQFMSHQRVTISKSSLDKESRDTFTWIPPENEMFGLMTMLKASQLCINIASTTSLDAAACGIPVINVAFDGYRKEKYLHSVRRFYDFSHYKDVVQTGAVKMVYNEQELIQWINKYLEDSELDQEKREKLISEQCWKLDGKASERVAEIVSDFADESSNK